MPMEIEQLSPDAVQVLRSWVGDQSVASDSWKWQIPMAQKQLEAVRGLPAGLQQRSTCLQRGRAAASASVLASKPRTPEAQLRRGQAMGLCAQFVIEASADEATLWNERAAQPELALLSAVDLVAQADHPKASKPAVADACSLALRLLSEPSGHTDNHPSAPHVVDWLFSGAGGATPNAFDWAHRAKFQCLRPQASWPLSQPCTVPECLEQALALAPASCGSNATAVKDLKILASEAAQWAELDSATTQNVTDGLNKLLSECFTSDRDEAEPAVDEEDPDFRMCL